MGFGEDLNVGLFRLGWMDAEQRVVGSYDFIPPSKGSNQIFEVAFSGILESVRGVTISAEAMHLLHRAPPWTVSPDLETHFLGLSDAIKLLRCGVQAYFYALKKVLYQNLSIQRIDTVVLKHWSLTVPFEWKPSSIICLYESPAGQLRSMSPLIAYFEHLGLSDQVIERVVRLYETDPFGLWDGLAEVIRAFSGRIDATGSYRHYGDDSGGGAFFKRLVTAHQPA